jgi:hypothetical protein
MEFVCLRMCAAGTMSLKRVTDTEHLNMGMVYNLNKDAT